MPNDAVEMLAFVVNKLNHRPRKCLSYRTPQEIFQEARRGALGKRIHQTASKKLVIRALPGVSALALLLLACRRKMLMQERSHCAPVAFAADEQGIIVAALQRDQFFLPRDACIQGFAL